MTERHTVFVGHLSPGWRARMREALDDRLDDSEHQPPLSAIWPSDDDDVRRPTRLGETLEEIMDNLRRDEPTDPWERRKAGFTPTSDKPAL